MDLKLVRAKTTMPGVLHFGVEFEILLSSKGIRACLKMWLGMRESGKGKHNSLNLTLTLALAECAALLDVQKITQDCALGELALRQLTEPVVVDDQRAAGLRYGQPRVQALMTAILGFALQVCGFTNRELRERLAPLLGLAADQISAGRMTYDLRRLRLHGLIERVPKSHRYRLTRKGIITAIFFTRSYARVLRSGMAQAIPIDWSAGTPLRRSFDTLLQDIYTFVADAKLTP